MNGLAFLMLWNKFYDICNLYSGRGFIVINNEGSQLSQTFSTGMPAGQYCDVISCDNNRPPCGNSGGACRATITVDGAGNASITVPSGNDPVVAIYV